MFTFRTNTNFVTYMHGYQPKLKEYYYKMLCQRGLRLASSYLAEERSTLTEFFTQESKYDKFNFIAIGAGPLVHLDIAQQFTKRYIAIDPIIDIFLNNIELPNNISNITFLKKCFASVNKKDIPTKKRIFIFLFNVIAHIKEPVKNINKLITPGDVLFFSTWRNSKIAQQVAKEYFSHVSGEKITSSKVLKQNMLKCDLKSIIANINNVKSVTAITNKIGSHYLIKI